MVNWVIIGLVIALIAFLYFKNSSYSDPPSPPGPAPGPPPKYTQTMVISQGGSCPDSTWTKIGNVTCAK